MKQALCGMSKKVASFGLALVTMTLIQGTAIAGAVGGEKAAVDVVKANSADVYTIRFYGGEKATVAAVSDEGDIDLYIYDENGNLIVKDTSISRKAGVQWTPEWTGTFKVKVVNATNQNQSYALVTD